MRTPGFHLIQNIINWMKISIFLIVKGIVWRILVLYFLFNNYYFCYYLIGLNYFDLDLIIQIQVNDMFIAFVEFLNFVFNRMEHSVLIVIIIIFVLLLTFDLLFYSNNSSDYNYSPFNLNLNLLIKI